jgi:hypothetical protein
MPGIRTEMAASAADFTRLRLRSIPWRRVAIDAAILALFVITSSWFWRE